MPLILSYSNIVAMTSLERFIAATKCQSVDRPPIWLMRQAGRYLPEYRALKEKYDFLTMVRTPELATEVTLQPLKRFPLDAAIIFSDILVIPEAMGQAYHFREAGGIGMDYTIDHDSKIDALTTESIADHLSYVADALRLTRKELGNKTALLGFCGSPWTLATYMVEGGSSKDFSKIKELALENTASFETLMQKITKACIEYLKLQIEAGVDALQIFDSWGAICPAPHYHNWSLQWIQQIIEAIGTEVPVILYAKGMGHSAPAMQQTGASVLSLDWSISMPSVRQQIGSTTALQGNLDPVILKTTPEITQQETVRLLNAIGTDPGYIINLGHGMLPTAKIECVEALVNTVVNHKNA